MSPRKKEVGTNGNHAVAAATGVEGGVGVNNKAEGGRDRIGISEAVAK